MFYSPRADSLKKFVVCYWLIETSHIPVNTKMMPDGYSDIMLNLATPYRVQRIDGSTATIESSAVFGQRTEYLLLQQYGKVNMIGIRLKPGTESAFFDQPADLVNRHVLLHEIFAPDVTIAENDLKQLTNPNQKIDRVETLLMSHLQTRKNRKHNPIPDILLSPPAPQDKLESLLEKAGLSYKQAERLFKKHLGLTPKQYFRVIRFHRTYSGMRDQKNTDWLTILHQNGYYDQAHFIKDFKYFTGQSPARQKSLKDSLDDFFNL